MRPPARSAARPLADALGAVRLASDATVAAADVVEAMHARIGTRAFRAGGRRRGISGFVYRRVRGVAGWVARAALAGERRAAVAGLAAEARALPPSPRRDAFVAALNGVVGDTLAASANPLALGVGVRRAGRDLDPAAVPDARPDVVVLLHGLCMNDLQWAYGGHHHGRALERDAAVTAVELRYNSGRHVADTGRDVSDVLGRLVAAWPVPVRSLTLVGHSMGGLVARSAAEHARRDAAPWLGRLRRLVCLGTPHAGSPVERGGHAIDRLLGASTWTAPLARVGQLRSAGVTDLRRGAVIDAARGERFRRDDPPEAVALPEGVETYLLAATRGATADSARGDGLVPVASALGRDAARGLGVPPARTAVLVRTHHFELLGAAAYPTLLGWLGRPPSAGDAAPA